MFLIKIMHRTSNKPKDGYISNFLKTRRQILKMDLDSWANESSRINRLSYKSQYSPNQILSHQQHLNHLQENKLVLEDCGNKLSVEHEHQRKILILYVHFMLTNSTSKNRIGVKPWEFQCKVRKEELSLLKKFSP